MGSKDDPKKSCDYDCPQCSILDIIIKEKKKEIEPTMNLMNALNRVNLFVFVTFLFVM